ncbi:MAG: heat-inducible transcriptional repressor HrcA [Melioribacteraceae bacterium]|nr:heat-inducible transcriptional repressor HrcA [Melioribacteraceae bacterium]MCF8263269.1 heat-inducible transcriptional repressor HrcA [Melioribacteraceae bacterium]MCF8412860.1 heat-inducible transcriptional repressor HrcA [Melioribacteraceae bacterium]MCF8430709.1 heat-inducible transcriptional repressor HrcA [Melioribacteraceae bacterium]
MQEYELTDREKSILRYVIHQFILTASPVGSRNISKRYNVGLSPATIRNIMADLEETGYLNHPHTSAGRIPTDKGYRLYVDMLMDPPRLNASEKRYLQSSMEIESFEVEDIIKLTAGILSDITNQLALVTFPKFENAILERIQLVTISSTRILVVLSIKSGFVKTITLEIANDVDQKTVPELERILNERLSGLRFSEIRNTFSERFRDYGSGELKPIIRVFIDSANKIFTDIKTNEKAILSGAKNILKQPEFEDQHNIESVIELIEDKDVIIHFIDSNASHSEGKIQVSIGGESKMDKLIDYSLVTKDYSIGNIGGTMGIVGPKRMQYSKSIASVIYLAELLSEVLKKSD